MREGLSSREENQLGLHKGGRSLILLPAYNEEGAIGRVIESIRKVFDGDSHLTYDILVVDGHSTDRTREIARSRGALVTKQPDIGKGNAVRFGLNRALVDEALEYSAIVMLDADGSYPPEAIPHLLARLKDGVDVVIGSRFKGRIDRGAMSRAHYIGNKFLCALASRLYGREVSDVCSGMWALTSEALQKLTLNSQHFELEAELFAQSSKANLVIDEIPIRYARRVGDTKLKSLRTGLSIAAKLFRKRFFP